jgi:Rrf2 family protein
MKVSAKADYAVRAATELAATKSDRPLKAERISEAQGIPIKFLEAILLELKHANVVKSTRGAEGGYALARPATEISIADVIRAVDGPLANVRGERPEDTSYKGSAENLTRLWVAVRASLREVLEQTSLADLISGKFPKRVHTLSDAPNAWQSPGRSGAR